ncbi:MAG: phosphate ABC transporter permease PstA [Pirellulaceae bacterium]
MADANRSQGGCYVVHSAEVGVAGPNFQRFPTMEEAVSAVVGQGSVNGHQSHSNTLTSNGSFVIAHLSNEQSDTSQCRPRHRFYVDSHLLGSGGDGTERDPWPDVPTAAKHILSMAGDGTLNLRPNEQIVIESRKMFTATRLERKKMRKQSIAKGVFFCMTLSLVIPVFAILGYLFVQAWPALSWDFVTLNPKRMGTEGGIWAPLVGTFFLVLMSLLMAAPVGVMAGVYLNEYAKDNWFNRIINLAVVNLAGVPSIVHALFGLGAFVLAAGMGKSLLAASLTLSVMTLPVIITSTREALAAVPKSFREACWNMGATKWQTIRTIVLPNSISGILTGVILQVARAAGETAPIIFTGAAIFLPVKDNGVGYWLPYTLKSEVMALSMHLYTLREQINNAPLAMQYGTAVVLIGLVLSVNSVSIALRVYLRSRKKW